MVTIRFTRVGRKRQPSFRIVVQDKRRSPKSAHLELVGHYNPRTKETVLKEERIRYWLERGAQPSNTVHNLFVSKDIVKGAKRSVVTMTKKHRARLGDGGKKEVPQAPAPAAA